jgi:large subunit ribosomal protein L14
MKAINARVTRGVNIGTILVAADNSGALLVRLVGVKHAKIAKRTQMYAKVGDQIKVSVRKGLPEMKGKVFDAVIVRQKKPYRRFTGERIAFVDNAAVLLKDDKGNPKGTQVKGPVAREVHERYPGISKIAKFVL